LKNKVCEAGYYTFDFLAESVGVVGAVIRFHNMDLHYSVEFSTKWIRVRLIEGGIDKFIEKNEMRNFVKEKWYSVRLE